tara:strand:- start:2493 stop:3068 length:576 start_codon:yes stop_codon:yes gene_type:complete
MINTILYFHGFASSSDSHKAKIIKSHISKISKKIKVLTPDLSNDFIEANNQINKLINANKKDFAFVGSSLGGYFASFFGSVNNSKVILINPAIPPLKGFEQYIGENENYSTGEKFNITKKDIKFLRSLVINKFINQKNTLVLLESGDEVLNYVETAKYFRGSNIDITFGGNHSYESITKKLQKIVKFLEII